MAENCSDFCACLHACNHVVSHIAMFTVAVCTQKGGVGKTTLALTLGVLAEQSRMAVGVLDADPQAIASGWAQARGQPWPKGQGKASPTVAHAPKVELIRSAVGDAQADGLDWLIVDTPAGVSEQSVVVASLADLILMPSHPAAFSMNGLGSTVEMVKSLKKPAYFVINCGRSPAIDDACAVALTREYDLPVVPVRIARNMEIVNCEERGRSVLEMSSSDPGVVRTQSEFEALWRWVRKFRRAQETKG